MKWFGDSWGAPICQPEEWAPTPTHKACLECSEDIRLGDRGFLVPYSKDGSYVAFHLQCMLGSVGADSAIVGHHTDVPDWE